MTALASIPDLIERLGAATGPDRDLDREIGLALGELHVVDDETSRENGQLYMVDPEGTWVFGGLSEDIIIRRYTASADMSLMLAERIFPGVWWILGKGKTCVDEPLYGARLLFGAGEALGEGEHDASLPLAICIAVLRARQSS